MQARSLVSRGGDQWVDLRFRVSVHDAKREGALWDLCCPQKPVLRTGHRQMITTGCVAAQGRTQPVAATTSVGQVQPRGRGPRQLQLEGSRGANWVGMRSLCYRRVGGSQLCAMASWGGGSIRFDGCYSNSNPLPQPLNLSPSRIAGTARCFSVSMASVRPSVHPSVAEHKSLDGGERGEWPFFSRSIVLYWERLQPAAPPSTQTFATTHQPTSSIHEQPTHTTRPKSASSTTHRTMAKRIPSVIKQRRTGANLTTPTPRVGLQAIPGSELPLPAFTHPACPVCPRCHRRVPPPTDAVVGSATVSERVRHTATSLATMMSAQRLLLHTAARAALARPAVAAGRVAACRQPAGVAALTQAFSSHCRVCSARPAPMSAGLPRAAVGVWSSPMAIGTPAAAGRAVEWKPQVRTIKTRKRLRQIFEKQKAKGPKLKTVQGVRKRFRRTSSGMLKYARSGRVHNSQAKSKNKHRQLRKPGYVTGTMLKTLNRMLSKR